MKKIVPIILCIVCVLSIFTIGYATNTGLPVSYRGGVTDNSVTKLPADTIAESENFTVSNEVPQRNGYEFLEWELDYKQEVKYKYTVCYVRLTGGEIAERKEVYVNPGETVYEIAKTESEFFPEFQNLGYEPLTGMPDNFTAEITEDDMWFTFIYNYDSRR